MKRVTAILIRRVQAHHPLAALVGAGEDGADGGHVRAGIRLEEVRGQVVAGGKAHGVEVVAALVPRLVGQLQPHVGAVLERSRLQLAAQVRLVGQVQVVRARLEALPADRRRLAGGSEATGRGGPGEAVHRAEAQRVGQVHPAVTEEVLELGGAHVGIHALGVQVLHAVEGLAADAVARRDGVAVVVGLPVVRGAVLVLVEVVHVQRRAPTQLELRRGSEARAVLRDVVSAGHAGQLPQRVEAHLGVVAEGLVDVHLHAARRRRAARQAHVAERAPLGLLRHQVDRATGGAAPEEDGRGAEEDLDTAQVEGVAREPAQIPHAIAEGVRLRREATQVECVSLAAALARGDGDARDVAQRIAHRRHLLLLEHLARYHGDRLRRVHQGPRHPLQLALTRVVGLGLLLHLHRGHDEGVLRGRALRRSFGGWRSGLLGLQLHGARSVHRGSRLLRQCTPRRERRGQADRRGTQRPQRAANASGVTLRCTDAGTVALGRHDFSLSGRGMKRKMRLILKIKGHQETARGATGARPTVWVSGGGRSAARTGRSRSTPAAVRPRRRARR